MPVFPTCVGVFLAEAMGTKPATRLPHVRGGVSKRRAKRQREKSSSPRAWGCFHQRHPLVGMRLGLPHVRGGVSQCISKISVIKTSSPRAWGCFSSCSGRYYSYCVFPTCVGVFPTRCSTGQNQRSLPHVRGGVSGLDCFGLAVNRSSPRAWGCFYPRPESGVKSRVFPTCVGVFLRSGFVTPSCSSLPHVRGGVSCFLKRMLNFCQSSPRAWGCFHGKGSRRRRTSVFPTCVGVFPSR